MRIPIGETEKGAFYKINNNSAIFLREHTWSYDYHLRADKCRIGTWLEFKELYPYHNGNNGYRCSEKTKFNARYNK